MATQSAELSKAREAIMQLIAKKKQATQKQ